MRGGDPSKSPIISLSEPNKTLEEAEKYTSSMNTGLNDPYNTRSFIFKDNNPMIFYQQKRFNGYEVISEPQTPFTKQLQVYGSDGMQIKPLASSDQLQYIYIDSTKRVSEMEQVEELERYGFSAHRY